MTLIESLKQWIASFTEKKDGPFPPAYEQINTDKVIEATPVVVKKAPVAQSVKWVIPSYKPKSRRRLPKRLEELIDVRLMDLMPVEFKAAVEAKDANLIKSMADIALESFKIREKSNKNDGFLVELIQKTVGGKKGQAWCMYLQQASVGYAEIKTDIMSFMYASGSCASVRTKTPAHLFVDAAKSLAGDVWIFLYDTGTGHTGGFIRWLKKALIGVLVEGNTTKGKAGDVVVREGGGCYQTERSIKRTDNMKLAVVIRPFKQTSNNKEK